MSSPGLLAALLPWILGAFVLAFALAAWRLLRGPSLADRMLALDAMYTNALALVVVAGMWMARRAYIEVALLIGLLGFVGTLVLARYLLETGERDAGERR